MAVAWNFFHPLEVPVLKQILKIKVDFQISPDLERYRKLNSQYGPLEAEHTKLRGTETAFLNTLKSLKKYNEHPILLYVGVSSSSR